ncbi:MAG: cupin domain-containing protein [Rhodospirillaceae bacterium]|nr:cupin domain-containing protein [Rhodospirillaceae bacterium]
MKEVDVNSESEVLLKSALSRTEYLPKYRAEPQVFRYREPDLKGRPRAITRLFVSDLMCGLVQLIKKGGETTLHSHSGMDGLWMVLSGRARFYGEEEKIIAELGPLEGVYIPRDVKYWFESASEEEPLQILQIEGFVKNRANTYTSYGAESSADDLERQAKLISFLDAGETKP